MDSSEIVPGITNQDLLEILDSVALEEERDSDMTTAKAAEHWGVNQKQALVKLDLLVKEGKLIKIWGMTKTHKPCWLYRLPE